MQETGDRLAEAFRDMLLIRRFEEKAGQLFAAGLIGGYCHLSIGLEAVAVGLRAAARPGDRIAPSHRAHGHLLAWGADPGAVMAELLGRAGGLSGGRGGSLHMAAPSLGVFGGLGLGSLHAAAGTGLALAGRLGGAGAIAFVCLGDGAGGTAAGSFRLAAALGLPALFVIETEDDPGDGPGEGPTDSMPALRAEAAAAGIPGAGADGMSFPAVREAAGAAAAHVRAGGPFALELRTRRFRGHSHAPPPGTGRRSTGARRDPVAELGARLAPALRAAIEHDVAAAVARAAAFAEASPEPGATALPHGAAP